MAEGSGDPGAAAAPIEAAVYLDNAATTPLDPRVAGCMVQWLTGAGAFGNPASEHAYGRRARTAVERARSQVATLLGCAPADLVFTSGATESNNLAILGTVRARRPGSAAHIVTATTEHKSVLDACRQLEREGCEVSYLAPDGQGLIDAQAVRSALRAHTRLVSLMHANNETGVLQDIAAIGAICREHGIALHVDAAQSVGKVATSPEQLGADLLGFTAHKLHGPKGIGALYVRPAARAGLQPLLFGGGQERGLRAGTLAVHQIVGLGEACALAHATLAHESQRLRALTERLWTGLAPLPGVLRNGHPTRCVPGILSVTFRGVEGESLMRGLEELALASGSACNSDTDEPSHVLRALGHDTQLAQSSLRFSLGRFSTEADVDRALAAVRRELTRLRALAP